MKQINWSDHILNFLAVIIGVTLAFYVSDSANRAQQDAELDKIVQSFIDELEEDRETYFDYQIPSNEKQSKLISEAITFIKEKNKDSLAIKLEIALSINSYSPAGITFHSIVSSGKLDLFENFSLRKDIANYYQLLSQEAEARGQLQVDFYMNQILPWIVNETSIMNPDMDEVINDDKLTNILILYKSFIDNKTRHYKYMSKECLTLQEKLKDLLSE